MFVDNVRIFVKAGRGGNGCKSLYRDKYNRRGTPNGGDGGRGADIIIRADRNRDTLLDFQYKRDIRGLNAGHGSGKNKKGHDAPSLILRVPCGTIIKDFKTDCVLRDLDNDQEEFVVAKGGKGGLGNSHHHREATPGEEGEARELLLDLKLIADVGIVGFPNAGKSTLVASVSNASPKIAAYPFTTKSPVLGVVNKATKPFVIADIPGLIKGAWQGRGLGDKFLRHIERTKILVHLVDISGFEGRDPIEDYRAINNELKNYSPLVCKKPQIIALNKMDLENSAQNLIRFRKAIKKKAYPVSALKKEGLEELIAAISKKL